MPGKAQPDSTWAMVWQGGEVTGKWRWHDGHVCYGLPNWKSERCATYRVQVNDALMSRDGKHFQYTLDLR